MCFKTIISNIILPKVLIFSFDLEETNDNNSDYNNFVNNQPNIRKILEYNININNRNELVTLIHIPSYDHYSAG